MKREGPLISLCYPGIGTQDPMRTNLQEPCTIGDGTHNSGSQAEEGSILWMDGWMDVGMHLHRDVCVISIGRD